MKKDEGDDPCVDLPGSNALFKEMEGEEAQKELDSTTGQIATYAMAILSRQHRTHCFSIGVFGSKARFYRWDRAGVVISSAFDYTKEPLLSEFAKRYCQATDAQRGRDMSICRATEEEEEKFGAKIREHVMELYAPKDEKSADELVKKHYQEKSVFKYRIWPQPPKDLEDSQDIFELQATGKHTPYENEDDKEFYEDLGLEAETDQIGDGEFDDVEEAKLALKKIGQEPTVENDAKGGQDQKRRSACRSYTDIGRYQYFLVSRPVAASISIAGRATHGYWAVKIPDRGAEEGPDDYRICFLKDTWRIATTDMEKEGDIMVELFEAGVDYISDILCHGDAGLSGEEAIDDSSEYIVNNFLSLIVTYLLPQDHETKTNELIHESWNCNKLGYTSGKHIHYRMVSVEVGCLLRELLGAYELFEATRMAFIGKYSFYWRNSILTTCFSHSASLGKAQKTPLRHQH